MKSPVATLKMIGAVLGVVFLGGQSGAAQAESRTISMYHVHTKERITITYWKDGRFIPSALRKLNWFLRDWRKRKAIRIDPRVIDLIWKLHADLGSKKPVHIICGHRSAATNAMLRRIGRRVARRSRHITGQAIDFRFPDVPQWKVRNLALAYGLGGVGYYGEGRNGFIHVDSGRVRHWPRLPQYKLARIIRQYRKLIGRGWKRGGRTIMVAARSGGKRGNFNVGRRGASGIASRKALMRQIAALQRRIGKMQAARDGKAAGRGTGASAPLALASASAPMPRPRPYEVLVLAASRMQVVPASAPATVTNFTSRSPVADPIGAVIASLPEEDAVRTAAERPDATPQRAYPRVMRGEKGDLAVALVNGDAHGVPVVDDLNVQSQTIAAGKGDLRLRLGAAPEDLRRRDGAPLVQQAGQLTAFFWPGAKAETSARGARGGQRVNRAGKGDLLTSRHTPEKLRKAALRAGAVKTAGFLPISFR